MSILTLKSSTWTSSLPSINGSPETATQPSIEWDKNSEGSKGVDPKKIARLQS